MKGIKCSEGEQSSYGNPDLDFNPFCFDGVKKYKSQVDLMSETTMQSSQNLERLDYLDDRDRYLEMQELVEKQINSITSKGLASQYHRSISNPESLLSPCAAHKK